MSSNSETCAFGYFFKNIRAIDCTVTSELIVPSVSSSDSSQKAAPTSYVTNAVGKTYGISTYFYQGTQSGANVPYSTANNYYYIFTYNEVEGYSVINGGQRESVAANTLTVPPNSYFNNATDYTPYAPSMIAGTGQGATPAFQFSNWPWSNFPGICTFEFGVTNFELNFVLPTANSMLANNPIVKWTFTSINNSATRPVYINCQESTFLNAFTTNGNATTNNKFTLQPGTTVQLVPYSSFSPPLFSQATFPVSGWIIVTVYP